MVNTLECIFRFLSYDEEMSIQSIDGMSIKDFFEATGGLDALQGLFQHNNFQVYSMASELHDTFFRNEVDEKQIEELFESDYKRGIKNIYDDQKHENENREKDEGHN